ncbi:hypothetical protein CTA2_6651 [Colletotrichum tanaceti]|uniref:Uncharacterized protein n=1 Tax=Colletotrichum tanaceti TaxID=1306861 RepID=A0A4U6X312_9PEZI|nr:hypothetical protein CTA2_6651 [Colletotrichum tanaceti]TKW49761.1 hypothetical protein CTA1_13198 [Colletotrichum tanaceti]
MTPRGRPWGHDSPALVRNIFGVAQYFLARPAEVGASVHLDAALAQGPREPRPLHQRLANQAVSARRFGTRKKVARSRQD